MKAVAICQPYGWLHSPPQFINQRPISPIPPPPSTHIHNPVGEPHPDVDGLGQTDRACNGIPMLNTTPGVFCHLG